MVHEIDARKKPKRIERNFLTRDKQTIFFQRFLNQTVYTIHTKNKTKNTRNNLFFVHPIIFT